MPDNQTETANVKAKSNTRMKRILYYISIAFTVFTVSACLCNGNATETTNREERIANKVEFDKVIHNFGDIMLSDGPQSCEFSMKNIGDKPVVIYSVVTSCGCTNVKWTREPILPGKTAKITATYTNDEGPYPFDKTLTAYISDISKPVILHLRGISHKKKMSIESLYPKKMGPLGVKSDSLKCGNVEQGGCRSDEVNIANLSETDVNVSFSNVSKGLSIKVTPNPIPAKSVAKLQFTVTSDRSLWGKNIYHASVNADKKSTGGILNIYAFTKENFSNLTDQQRADGSRPIFDSSTYSAGKIKAGEMVNAVWTFTNAGKNGFNIYKIDSDKPDLKHDELPNEVPSGHKGSIRLHLDTTGMPKGEMLVMATLTTNSPTRPIINLFITGWIE